MLESIMRWLAHRGHECRVNVIGSDYEYHGVKVTSNLRDLDGCHVIFTQLEGEYQALSLCDETPLVHVIHNHMTLKLIRPRKTDLVVHNTQWLADECPEENSVIVHPPVDGSLYKTTPGDCITLINLCRDKGPAIFYDLARLMPDRKFLGVKGGYGEQIIEDLPNVEILEQVEDMREVYSRTKILLMPSVYESYGRCSTEAAASGIPTIANPTPGLLEALGEAGTFPEELTAECWKDAIESMDWQKKSRQTKALFKSLDPEAELQNMEEHIYRIVEGG